MTKKMPESELQDGIPLPQSPHPPKVLADGRYEVGKIVGEGGMGYVFQARETTFPPDGRDVAIKFLKPTREADRAGAHQRFLDEIALAGKLSIPHVVPVFDAGEQDGWLYYVMPLLDKPEKLTEFADVRAGSLDAKLKLLEEAIRAVGELHTHSSVITHRDLKPDNLPVDANGRLWICDLGLAFAAEEGLMEKRGETIGVVSTPEYMSPEQAAGKKRAHGELDTRTDVYALGVVAYYLLTDRFPYDFEGSMLADANTIRSEPPRPINLYCRDLSEQVAGVLMQSLQKAPEQRWENAAVFADALKRAIAGETVELPLSSPESEAVAGGPLPSSDAGRTHDVASSRVAKRRQMLGRAAFTAVLVLALGFLLVWALAPDWLRLSPADTTMDERPGPTIAPTSARSSQPTDAPSTASVNGGNENLQASETAPDDSATSSSRESMIDADVSEMPGASGPAPPKSEGSGSEDNPPPPAPSEASVPPEQQQNQGKPEPARAQENAEEDTGVAVEENPRPPPAPKLVPQLLTSEFPADLAELVREEQEDLRRGIFGDRGALVFRLPEDSRLEIRSGDRVRFQENAKLRRQGYFRTASGRALTVVLIDNDGGTREWPWTPRKGQVDCLAEAPEGAVRDR
jgi:eukaryotic-like serine/threonine-protein kinase